MEQGKRLVINSLVSVLARPLDAILALLLTPFVLHHLGKATYGVWSLTGSVLAYSVIFRVGLNSAVNLHIPRLRHQRDLAGINRVVSTAGAFYLVSAAVCLALVVILAWKFPYWFNVEPRLRAESHWVAALVGAAMVISIPLSVFSGVLTGVQRYDLMEGPRMVLQVARAIAIVVAFTMGLGLLALATISVVVTVGTSLLLAYCAYRVCAGLTLSPKYIDWQLLPGMIAYGASTFLFISGQVIQLHSGKALAGLLFDTEAVTELTMPLTMLLVAGGIIASSTRALKPAVSLLEAQHNQAAIREAFVLSTKYSSMIAIPAAFVFLLHGETVLGVWLGAQYVGAGGLLLAVMAVPSLMQSVNMAGFFVLAGLARHRVFGGIVLVKSIISVVLAYALAGPLGLGLLGIAVGFAVPEFIASALIIPSYCCRVLGLNIGDEIKQSLFPALKAAIPFLLYCIAVRHLAMDSKWQVVVVFGVATIPWVLGIWFLGLTAQEQSRFAKYLSTSLPWRRASAGHE